MEVCTSFRVDSGSVPSYLLIQVLQDRSDLASNCRRKKATIFGRRRQLKTIEREKICLARRKVRLGCTLADWSVRKKRKVRVAAADCPSRRDNANTNTHTNTNTHKNTNTNTHETIITKTLIGWLVWKKLRVAAAHWPWTRYNGNDNTNTNTHTHANKKKDEIQIRIQQKDLLID